MPLSSSAWVRARLAGASALFAGITLWSFASQGGETILYSFKGGNDGKIPYAALTAGFNASLLGTTDEGGGTDCFSGKGCGVIFELAQDGTEQVLYTFGGGCDGQTPEANLIADQAGDLFGTTLLGGACSGLGFGTVFELAASGGEQVIHAFGGLSAGDGSGPEGPVIFDTAGDLYGTTVAGGNAGCGGGCGTIFKITPDGTESIVYAFMGGTDGFAPSAGLLSDSAGDLFGTAKDGGNANCNSGDGCGTVFKIASDGTFSVLYTFQGGSDGEAPKSTLVEDSSGDLYGTTIGGGGNCNCGTVFRLAPDGTETILHGFQGGTDGKYPYAGVVMDSRNNLYGTTYSGGGGAGCHAAGCGTVFKVTPGGVETVLYAFRKREEGSQPVASLILGAHGLLYGTASKGGAHEVGLVFSVKK